MFEYETVRCSDKVKTNVHALEKGNDINMFLFAIVSFKKSFVGRLMFIFD